MVHQILYGLSIALFSAFSITYFGFEIGLIVGIVTSLLIGFLAKKYLTHES